MTDIKPKPVERCEIWPLAISEEDKRWLENLNWLRTQLIAAFGIPQYAPPREELGRYFEKIGLTEPQSGTCPICLEKKETVCARHRNTAYVEPAVNWWVACDECHEEDTANWQERWDDYWNSRL